MRPDGQQERPVERNSAGAFASAFAKRSDGSEHSILAFKFGGSSLLGAERMLHAAGIVREAASRASVVVVVSAMKRVTDRLLAIARTLEAGCRTDARRDAEHVFSFTWRCFAISIWNRKSTIAFCAHFSSSAKICYTMRLLKHSRARQVAPRCKIVSRPTASDSAPASLLRPLKRLAWPRFPSARRNLF